jgi:hypothetical protein
VTSMRFWSVLARRDSLTRPEAWRLRLLTLEAVGWLCLARLMVACAPFGSWSGRLGLNGTAVQDSTAKARRLALHIERAVFHLPFELLCLPRAMALSWLLRRRAIPHQLVIAARPADQRGGADDLHAWIESEGHIVLGALPGPWLETVRLPPLRSPSD